MNTQLSFGSWLKQRRKSLDLTQEALGERVGCARITIQKLELDQRRPSQLMAERLAEELAIPPSERTAFIHYARAVSEADGQERPASFADASSSLLPSAQAQPAPEVAASTLFVGRERQLAMLATHLGKVRQSQGQIVFVAGDAGRGKTALVHEFVRRLQEEDPSFLVVEGACNAHSGIGDPYLPFRDALARLVGEVESKPVAPKFASPQMQQPREIMPIILRALVEHAPDLIGTFVAGDALVKRAAAFATPEMRWWQRLTKLVEDVPVMRLEERRIFAQYAALLKAIAAQRPLLLILEDLHWIDAASSSLLFHLSRVTADSRILMVGTYRADALAAWKGGDPHPLTRILGELKRQHGDIWLDLDNIPDGEARQFIDAYLDAEPNRFDETFRALLLHRTGGNALFVVELLHTMQEKGNLQRDSSGRWTTNGVLDWYTLPSKIEGVVVQRIAGLSAELQAMLAIASVEGELFTAEIVARVVGRKAHEVVELLSRELDRQQRLVTVEALKQTGGQRLSRYRFRHYLFQHYLYHRLDSAERAYLHEGIGSALESLYGEQSEQVAVQLAHHYERAGVTEKAVNYLLQAGEQAKRLSAHQEAIQHLTHGLALLAGVADTPQRARQELAIQISLGHALASAKGPLPEVGQAYNRARELALQTGEAPKLFAALRGMYGHHAARAELQTAYTFTEQMLHLAEHQPDPIFRLSAHHDRGHNLMLLGEFAAAREHLEQALRLYQPQDAPSHLRLFGRDHGIDSLGVLAWTLWFLGYPEQALQRGQEALAQAEAMAQPATLAGVLTFVTGLHLSRQDTQVALQFAEALIRLATERGLAFRPAFGIFHRGLALVRQGKQEGIEQMQSGLNAWHATDFELLTSYFLAGLAEGYASVGETGQALHLLAEALALMDKNGDRFWEAEVYRLKGEMLRKQHQGKESSPTDLLAEVEACYQQAIEIARRQQAKSFELRATTSLCRLWQAQGKRAEAHTLLAEIYNWFTEGFDTADLLEAKALLEALQ